MFSPLRPLSPSPAGRGTILAAGLALLLSACGGSDSGRGDHPATRAMTGTTTATSQASAAVQVQGAALNAQELLDARTEAASLPINAPRVDGQTAPLAAYTSGEVAQKAAAVQLPVYRFYNTQTGTHFYTSSSSERDAVLMRLVHMRYEGQAFQAAVQPSTGLKPVYRLYNTLTGVHFYTISDTERDLILSSLPQFKLEGVAYYASPLAGMGLAPLYRFFVPGTGTHFFTASAIERQGVQDTLGATHTFEGVGYHVLTGDCALVNATRAYAQPNDCLLANNASEVAITLPLSADLVVGDTLRVSGLGAGGWRVAQNAAQRVQNTLPGAQAHVWTSHESVRQWRTVASSTDGSKLAAAEFDGQIYTSGDSGLTWTPHGPKGSWISIASSADGSQLVAVEYSGLIYTSSDTGRTWTARDTTTRFWISVTSSADGNKLAAVASNSQIYISTDAGHTWVPRGPNGIWFSVASSADGNKLVALAYGGQIYTSSDAGVTWTPRESDRGWFSVASSADGNRLVAAVQSGQIYTSGDAGVTWIARETSRSWSSVASSADGNKLVASVEDGQIYTSSDAGVTWTPRESSRFWTSVASSADGSKLVAAVYGELLYTARTSTAPGKAGFLKGHAGSTVELKYLGDGVFEVLTSSGQVTAESEV